MQLGSCQRLWYEFWQIPRGTEDVLALSGRFPLSKNTKELKDGGERVAS